MAFCGTFATAADPKPTPIAVAVPKRTEAVSYAKEVADILAEKCVGCHSDALTEGKLNLEEISLMLKGGKRGPALLAGKADESLLFQMAAHRVEPVMPPKDKKDLKPLTPEELGLLKLWIDAGAKDDSAENAEPAKAVVLGELPPGVQPINAVDMTADGSRVASGRANVVQVHDVDSGLEIIALGGHKDIIQSVRYSPNGRLLAAGSYQVVTLWNVPTGGLTATFTGHSDQIKTLGLLPDGKTVVSAGLDKHVKFWNLADGKPLRDFATPATVEALAVSPDGNRLALGCGDHVVRVVEVASGKELFKLEGHAGPVLDVAFFADNHRAASVSADGTGRVWTIPDSLDTKPSEPVLIEPENGPLRALCLNTEGTRLVTAGDHGAIDFWDPVNGDSLGKIAGPAVLSLAISPDGQQLLAGSADRKARLYDVANWSLVKTLEGHPGPVTSTAFSPDGSRLATAGEGGGLKVWETSTGQGVIAFGHAAPIGGPIQAVRKVIFGSNRSLISASADKTLKAWSFDGVWSERNPLGPHAFRVLALDFNPDSTLLAAGGGEPTRSGEIKVWEVGKGLHVRTLDGVHSDTVFAVRFSPDGTRLASGGADKFLKVTRVADGKEVRSLEGHTHHVLAVDWKADNTQIISGGADNVIKLWDFESGEQVRTFQAAAKQITAVRWVPGKPDVVGASGDRLVKTWNADNGGVSRSFPGAGDYVFSVSTSNDGNRVAAGGADGVLFIWNGQNSQVIRKIEPVPAPK